MGFILYENMKITLLNKYDFLITTVMLTLLFALMTPKKSLIYFFLTGAILFAYPFYSVGFGYYYAMSYKTLYNQFLSVMRPYSNQSVNILSSSCEFAFPTVDYLQQRFTSRFGCYMWDPVRHHLKNESLNKKYASFHLQSMISDISKYKPKYIFIDVRKSNPEKKQFYFNTNQFDYIKFLSSDSKFLEQWKQYKYLKTINGPPLYKFQIYERSS
jgi:hypothetical protein